VHALPLPKMHLYMVILNFVRKDLVARSKEAKYPTAKERGVK
jgi:hypothetical protein